MQYDKRFKIHTKASLDTSHMTYATTGEFSHLAKNHCAAIMLMNICLYYGYGTNSRSQLFVNIHKVVGNGPVIFIEKKARRAFRNISASIDIKRIKGPSKMKEALDNKYPLGILITDKRLHMHWIMAVGYSIYQGQLYLHIIDGWNRDRIRLLKIGGPGKILRVFYFKKL